MYLYHLTTISYDGGHREQDVPEQKNNNNAFSHRDCEVQQELYLAHQYEKAQQDVGLFCYLSIKYLCGMKHLKYLEHFYDFKMTYLFSKIDKNASISKHEKVRLTHKTE